MKVAEASHFLRKPPYWVAASAAMILCLLAFGLLFPEASSGAIRVWIGSPTFNHCFLVPLLSGFLIWKRRQDVEQLTVSPDFRALVVLLLLGALWAVSTTAGVLEAEQFVVMTMVQATLFGLLGETMYRRLLAPFLYLYFLVPTGAFLVPALQAFTAKFAVIGLHLVGIPVFSDGAVIDIPAGTFAVAEACAGLRFLIAAVAFGAFFSVLTYRSWWRRAAFIGLSIVVPIVANGIRAFGLIAVAEWIGSPQAALADHLLYGWIFFSLVMIALIFIGHLFSDRDDADPGNSLTPADTEIRVPVLRRMTLVGGTCLTVVVLASHLSSWLLTADMVQVAADAPRVSAPWSVDATTSNWRPVVVSPTRSFLESFANGKLHIDRFVALYAQQGHANNLVRSENRDADEKTWTFNSSSYQSLQINGEALPVHVTTWLHGPTRRTVWSFFVVGGRPVSSVARAKWDQLLDYFTRNRCVSAYVALSAVDSDESSGIGPVEDFLAKSEKFPGYLCPNH